VGQVGHFSTACPLLLIPYGKALHWMGIQVTVNYPGHGNRSNRHNTSKPTKTIRDGWYFWPPGEME
jgi:hypothetical protein